MGCIYVIRTFVRTGKTIAALPPTICFERDLALEMAQADEPEAEGVAVYELDGAAHGETEAKPFAAFGPVPGPVLADRARRAACGRAFERTRIRPLVLHAPHVVVHFVVASMG